MKVALNVIEGVGNGAENHGLATAIHSFTAEDESSCSVYGVADSTDTV